MLKIKFSRRTENNLWGFLFLFPTYFLVVALLIYPLINSFYLSLHEWSPFNSEYIGFRNYLEIFEEDWIFLESYINSLIYALVTIPLGLIWALLISYLVQDIKFRSFWRSVLFLPTITSHVAIGMFWTLILEADTGLFNRFLRIFGVEGANWLGDSNFALYSICFIVVWAGTGVWMVVFLAALLDIPQSYYEAATIDGANKLQIYFKITLPLLTPTIFYYITNGLITVWLIFDLVYVMTEGGPGTSTMMPTLHIYNEGFQELRMGYASALGWIMAIIILIITLLNFIIHKKWVHYDR